MHDLRRTWATDTFYELAMNDVPVARELVMSWGGWVITDTGENTFKEHYLGTIPDEVVEQTRPI
jgi:hypothetical protein